MYNVAFCWMYIRIHFLCFVDLHVADAGSIPDGVIGFFHWHNPSGSTMALGSTQLLTEMSTRNVSGR